MSQSLILIDVLSSDFWKKKKKEKQPGFFFSQDWTCLPGKQLKTDLRVNL
jgi:hypothetical protein